MARDVPKPAASPRRLPEVVRQKALLLLAHGHSATVVARELGVDRHTLGVLRRSPEGRDTLHRLQREENAKLQEAVEQNRRRLLSLADRATDAIERALTSGKHFEALNAATAIYDRIGLPKAARVETTIASLDLSALSDDEARQLRALLAKAQGNKS